VEGNEKRCPYCAETIKAEAIRCKHCQADLTQDIAAAAPPTAEKKLGFFPKLVIVVVGLVVAFLAFGFFVGGSPEAQAKARARAAIELCHKEESSYTGPAGARQIISGACVKLENDFRTRFGFAP
jgi:hypothetical protein